MTQRFLSGNIDTVAGNGAGIRINPFGNEIRVSTLDSDGAVLTDANFWILVY